MARFILGTVVYSFLAVRALGSYMMTIVDQIIQEMYDLGIKFQEALIQQCKSEDQ